MGAEELGLSMNRRICRQVLDCGDGVFGVTALAVAALKISKSAADTATPPQSGDFEDSVAAVQDADALAAAPLRFMAPMRALLPWSRCYRLGQTDYKRAQYS